MLKNRHQTFAALIVLLFGCILFYWGTDGFRAFTAETARINKLIENKPAFPDVMIQDSRGREYPFSQLQGKYVLAAFIYTSCATVCPQIEMNMMHVYHLVPSQYLGKDIVFLNISFDPARDDPAVLDKYKDYFNIDGETWRMARVRDPNELNSLLKALGVIVIPDGNGNFTHNAAFYLVNKKGNLIDVMDYTKIDEAAYKITSMLQQGQGE